MFLFSYRGIIVVFAAPIFFAALIVQPRGGEWYNSHCGQLWFVVLAIGVIAWALRKPEQ